MVLCHATAMSHVFVAINVVGVHLLPASVAKQDDESLFKKTPHGGVQRDSYFDVSQCLQITVDPRGTVLSWSASHILRLAPFLEGVLHLREQRIKF